MAKIAVERVMDRVMLVVDCNDDAEANHVYNMFVSQMLDGRGISFKIEDDDADAPSSS